VNITCPRCGFSRELPADRAPSKAVIATCPHCACRFRLVPGTGATDVLSEREEPVDSGAHGNDAAQPSGTAHAGPDRLEQPEPPQGSWHDGGDDPLPPGAIVPGSQTSRSPSDSEPRRGPGSGDRRQPSGKNEPDAGEEQKNLGNLWGLLGGKNIFGQSGSRNDDRAGDRADERPDERDDQRPQDGKARRGLFGDDAGHGDDGRAASEAYAREAARFEDNPADENSGPANPWETAPEPDGWISAFYHTCMRVMFGAHNFFEHMRADTPQVRPLVFYLVISVIQVVIERVWSGIFLSLMSPSAASDPELEKMLILLSPQLSLPMTILLKTGVSVVQLYVLTALMHFTYGFIAGRRSEFSLVFQVAAYAAAPSLLCVVPLLGSIVGFIWMIACVLVGCRTVLNLTWPQALMGFAPVALLLAPLLLQVMKAAQF